MTFHEIPQNKEHLADAVFVHHAQQKEDYIDAEQMIH